MMSPVRAASAAVITRRPAASAFCQLGLPGSLGDNHVHAGVAQVQRVSVPLAAVADDGDGLVLQCMRELPSFS